MTRTLMRRRRTAIMLFLGVLFALGHSYFYFAEIRMFGPMCMIGNTVVATLCLYGALLLIFNSQGVRSRKVLAFEMGVVALAGIVILIRSVMMDGQESVRAAPAIMIYGNAYVYVCSLYLIELLYIGKVSAGSYTRGILLVLAMGVLYYAVICSGELPMTEIRSWRELFSNIGRFDVWFRFTIVVYPIWGMLRILRYKAQYRQWCQKNYSDMGYIDPAWIDYYFFGFFLLLCSYIIVILGNNLHSLLMYNICFVCFLGYAFCDVVNQQIPPPLRMVMNRIQLIVF